MDRWSDRAEYDDESKVMPWFEKFCRETGLMIHHITRPVSRTQEVNRKVEEKKINQTTTLRRTTIDEIEVRDEPSRNDRK